VTGVQIRRESGAANSVIVPGYHGIRSNPRDVRRYGQVIGLSLPWRM
jgi:hypothetical protein